MTKEIGFYPKYGGYISIRVLSRIVDISSLADDLVKTIWVIPVTGYIAHLFGNGYNVTRGLISFAIILLTFGPLPIQ